MTSPVITTKPVVYAPIPDTFEQATEYVVQLEPGEKEDHVFVGVEVKTLEISEQGVFMGMP